MPLDRVIYNINRHRPFTVAAGESYRFTNDGECTVFATLDAADGGRVTVEVTSGRPIEITAGTGPIQVELIALRRGY